MSALSSAIILKALDCLSARQEILAQNIANAGTPGYRPLRLSFERALQGAAGEGLEAVRAVSPDIATDPTLGPQDDVRLDLQLTSASATALRYAALVEVLAQQSRRDDLVLAGGG